MLSIISSLSFHFNPRAPCGARRYVQTAYQCKLKRFQSTRSVRSATNHGDFGAKLFAYFNPRAPCGARPCRICSVNAVGLISIHALRAERDQTDSPGSGDNRNFNPRAPCGARQCIVKSQGQHEGFQSTRSVRSATGRLLLWLPTTPEFQSTRSVRSATEPQYHLQLRENISIHALRAERDQQTQTQRAKQRGFQSTRSVRSATKTQAASDVTNMYFNPRAPCGARL